MIALFLSVVLSIDLPPFSHLVVLLASEAVYPFAHVGLVSVEEVPMEESVTAVEVLSVEVTIEAMA